jgi:hypothetical protein
MMEASGTNLIKDTGNAGTFGDFWTVTAGAGGTATGSYTTDRTPPYGTNVFKFVGSKTDDRANNKGTFAVTAGKVYTISGLVRGTGSFKAYIYDGTGTAVNSTAITAQDDYWSKFAVQITVANNGAGAIAGFRLVADNAVTVYFCALQVELSPYPTSFIPTTTAAATRKAETLKYAISGNRTAAQETIAIKFANEWSSGSGDSSATLHATDDDIRRGAFGSAGSSTYYSTPNHTQDVGAQASFNPGTTLSTSYVFMDVYSPNSDPNVVVYKNGTIGITKNTDYTVNDWSATTYFFLGTLPAGNYNSDTLIQKVAIFNRALSASEVAQVSTLMGYD